MGCLVVEGAAAGTPGCATYPVRASLGAEGVRSTVLLFGRRGAHGYDSSTLAVRGSDC